MPYYPVSIGTEFFNVGQIGLMDLLALPNAQSPQITRSSTSSILLKLGRFGTILTMVMQRVVKMRLSLIPLTLGAQYCDGMRGALVVYDPEDPQKTLYDGKQYLLSSWSKISQ